MKRDVTYSLNQEFVYTGTRSSEVIEPGTLLIAKDRCSREMLRFYEVLIFLEKHKDGTFHKNYFQAITKESDLRKYPLIYLESDVVLSFYFRENRFHLFTHMGKELYLQQDFRFFKPLFFDGYSSQ